MVSELAYRQVLRPAIVLLLLRLRPPPDELGRTLGALLGIYRYRPVNLAQNDTDATVSSHGRSRTIPLEPNFGDIDKRQLTQIKVDKPPLVHDQASDLISCARLRHSSQYRSFSLSTSSADIVLISSPNDGYLPFCSRRRLQRFGTPVSPRGGEETFHRSLPPSLDSGLGAFTGNHRHSFGKGAICS